MRGARGARRAAPAAPGGAARGSRRRRLQAARRRAPGDGRPAMLKRSAAGSRPRQCWSPREVQTDAVPPSPAVAGLCPIGHRPGRSRAATAACDGAAPPMICCGRWLHATGAPGGRAQHLQAATRGGSSSAAAAGRPPPAGRSPGRWQHSRRRQQQHQRQMLPLHLGTIGGMQAGGARGGPAAAARHACFASRPDACAARSVQPERPSLCWLAHHAQPERMIATSKPGQDCPPLALQPWRACVYASRARTAAHQRETQQGIGEACSAVLL